jgi:hypothetical protein
MDLLSPFDFLPEGFNPSLKVFIYVLIFVHIAALVFWCVLACPSMFQKKDSFQDQVDKMLQKNK